MSVARMVLFGLFGLLFGSFVTVLVARTPRKESVVRGRSHCPSCGATITARDNVPLASYVSLRGRCRHCRQPISPRYPLTELATTALFVGATLAFPDVFVAALMAPFLGLLLALALIDVEHRIIPNAILYPTLLLFAVTLVVGAVLGRHVDLAGEALGFLIFGGGLLVVALISPRGMGMGDVKLAALIGLVLGSQGLRYVAVAAGVAVLAGGLGAVAALLAGRSRKSAIPFGPYLAAGGMTAAFWGASLARTYVSFLH